MVDERRERKRNKRKKERHKKKDRKREKKGRESRGGREGNMSYSAASYAHIKYNDSYEGTRVRALFMTFGFRIMSSGVCETA